MLIPISDVSSQLLLAKEDIVGVKMAGPSASAYARASDKAHLLDVAAACGIMTPQQHVIESKSFERADLEDIEYPVVVKPARSVSAVDGKIERHGVHFVDSAPELRATIDKMSSSSFPLLVQQRTIGDGIGVFLLRSGRRTLLQFGHHRLREKPPAGGVSTYRESIEVPTDLRLRCESLLDELEYEGAAMIEFKRDAKSGEFVLMEINARLWGSLQLAIDAGVDFPTILVSLTMGLPIDLAPKAVVGVRSYWEIGELDHALAIGRRSRVQLHLPPQIPVGRRAAIRAIFDHRPEDHREVFRWRDPLPFLAEFSRWIKNQS